ncbi:hypothetical protein QFZ23_003011 [Arthrobacter globiformis]|nr:hypothetical protein [Arthrobacter globiformis]
MEQPQDRTGQGEHAGERDASMSKLNQIRSDATLVADQYGAMDATESIVIEMAEDTLCLVAALDAVLELHNSDGQRWVGFPRADRQERYCTHCNKAAPCPTIAAVISELEDPRG